MPMTSYALIKPVLLIAPLLLLAGCAHDELKVAQGSRVPASASAIIDSAANSQVNTVGEQQPQPEAQPANRADTLPTPDRSQWRPKMPMVRVGSCPGEDCTYGNLVTACEDLPLFATDSTGAKPTGIVVHRGDTVTLETANYHLLAPGIVLMKRDYAITDITDEDYKAPRPDTLRFFAGDTVYVLDYLELGEWNWWYRGKPGSGDEFWTGAFQRSHGPGDEKRPAVAISKPRGEWWYKLQVDTSSEGGWIFGGRGQSIENRFIPLSPDWTCSSRQTAPGA